MSARDCIVCGGTFEHLPSCKWAPSPPAAPEPCNHDGIGLPGCPTCDPSTGPRPGASQREPAAPEMPEGWGLSRVLTGEDTHVGWQFKHRRTAHVFVISRKAFTELLATQGLTIVPTSDVPSAEERERAITLAYNTGRLDGAPSPKDRAVLEACAAMATTTLKQAMQPRENNPQGKWHGPAEAELARRGKP